MLFGVAIDGMKDMDIIDLTNLSASDLMKFHFSNVGVTFTFYNGYAYGSFANHCESWTLFYIGQNLVNTYIQSARTN
jgi:hypothetical protein